MAKCTRLFGRHKWGEWTGMKSKPEKMPDGSLWQQMVQVRFCNVCGYRQIELSDLWCEQTKAPKDEGAHDYPPGTGG